MPCGAVVCGCCRLLVGDRQYTHKSTHHAAHWGEELTFLTPSCKGHKAEEHEG